MGDLVKMANKVLDKMENDLIGLIHTPEQDERVIEPTNIWLPVKPSLASKGVMYCREVSAIEGVLQYRLYLPPKGIIKAHWHTEERETVTNESEGVLNYRVYSDKTLKKIMEKGKLALGESITIQPTFPHCFLESKQGGYIKAILKKKTIYKKVV